jgi:hypothetical protein
VNNIAKILKNDYFNLCTEPISNIKTEISWETIIAILGALAWIPWLFDKFTRSKVYGNIISYLYAYGDFNDKEGMLYFLKLNLTCINKNFNVKSVKIYLKYPQKEKWQEGTIFWARTSNWKIENENKQLKIPDDNFLGFINVFEKDKSNFYYVTFIVKNKSSEDFEVIKFEFTNYNKRKVSFIIKRNEIEEEKILFDDKLWN